VPIRILNITDPDGDAVIIRITRIFQDEPTNGVGDGDTEIDGSGIGTDTARVRAERSGNQGDGDDDRAKKGNGRVYHIRFTATAGSKSCSGEVTVGVPHDQHRASVDDGAVYDSTAATPPPHGHYDGDGCAHDLGRNNGHGNGTRSSGDREHYDGDDCEHDRERNKGR
jgi:hypothetical protein